eukprot:m51a1_g7091 hypothetical protein (118) ;mRNA; r:27125-27478
MEYVNRVMMHNGAAAELGRRVVPHALFEALGVAPESDSAVATAVVLLGASFLLAFVCTLLLCCCCTHCSRCRPSASKARKAAVGAAKKVDAPAEAKAPSPKPKPSGTEGAKLRKRHD